MPYIDPEKRKQIDDGLTPTSPGELNYAITRLIHRYLDGPVCYNDLNEAIGVLECAKLELYRMVAAPYEDRKRRINGPVSDLDDDNPIKDRPVQPLPPIYKIDGEKVTKEEYDAFLQERERTSHSKDYVKPEVPEWQRKLILDEIRAIGEPEEPCEHAPGGG